MTHTVNRPILRAALPALAVAGVLGAVATGAAAQTAASPNAAPNTAAPMQEWRQIARAGDEAMLDQWEPLLIAAFVRAEQEGHGNLYQLDSQLYYPEVRAEQRALPPGDYSCRSIQIQTREGLRAGGLAYIAYQPFRCRVTLENGRRVFEKLTGSQTTKGVIYDAPDMTGDVYLGAYGTPIVDDRPGVYPAYGEDAARSEAAIVQRLEDGRYRMIFTGSVLSNGIEILELGPG